jgi:hypothetical protein
MLGRRWVCGGERGGVALCSGDWEREEVTLRRWRRCLPTEWGAADCGRFKSVVPCSSSSSQGGAVLRREKKSAAARGSSVAGAGAGLDLHDGGWQGPMRSPPARRRHSSLTAPRVDEVLLSSDGDSPGFPPWPPSLSLPPHLALGVEWLYCSCMCSLGWRDPGSPMTAMPLWCCLHRRIDRVYVLILLPHLLFPICLMASPGGWYAHSPVSLSAYPATREECWGIRNQGWQSQRFKIIETSSVNPTVLFIQVTKPLKSFALALSLTCELLLGTCRRPKAIVV